MKRWNLAVVTMMVAGAAWGQAPRMLPVPAHHSANVTLSKDGSTVLINGNFEGPRYLLWYPDSPAVEIPHYAHTLNRDGSVVAVSGTFGQQSSNVGFWGPEIGLRAVDVFENFGCGSGNPLGVSYSIYFLSPDGTWMAGWGSWAYVGSRSCEFRVDWNGPGGGGYPCAADFVVGASDVPNGHVSLPRSVDYRRDYAAISWSTGGCVFVNAIHEGDPVEPGSVEAAAISGDGQTAFISHRTGFGSRIFRHSATEPTVEMAGLTGLSTCHWISYDGNTALLRDWHGSGVITYLYDHARSLWIPLTQMLRNAGGIPQDFEVVGDAMMSWDGLRFVFRARDGGGTVSYWYVQIQPTCAADLDYSYTNDSDDIIAFFGLWEAGLPGGDFDGDGQVDSDDVAAFFEMWDAGC